MTDTALETFVRGLPKAELHMHIEGSLEPELMFELAARNGVTLPFKTVDEIRAAYAFSNLQDFLDIYYQGAGVLLTAADFKDLALAYFRRLKADGGTHVSATSQHIGELIIRSPPAPSPPNGRRSSVESRPSSA